MRHRFSGGLHRALVDRGALLQRELMEGAETGSPPHFNWGANLSVAMTSIQRTGEQLEPSSRPESDRVVRDQPLTGLTALIVRHVSSDSDYFTAK